MFKKVAESPFAIDPRSLAAFRIALGTLVAVELLVRWTDLTAHYTDQGILPRALAIAHYPQTTPLSLHFLAGGFAGQWALFAVHLLITACFILGWRTRVFSVLSWFMMISLQSRNEMILYGGDHYLRILLFWAMFLPLGALWSVDARKGAPARAARSPWTAAILLQVAAVYLFAGLLKTGVEWGAEGSALFYALSFEQLSRPVTAAWLLRFPSLLKALTPWVRYLEALTPVCLFLPWAYPIPRLGALAVLLVFHLGIAVFLKLYGFPWICMVPLLLFIPATVWDRVSRPLVGSSLEPFQPEARRRIADYLGFSVASALGALLVCWNWNIVRPGAIPIPRTVIRAVLALRLDQDWSFYSPYPFKDDGWFVIPGKLRDGRTVDLFRGGTEPVKWEIPGHLSTQYADPHWAAYHILLRQRGNEFNYPSYAGFLCRQWNSSHPETERLESVSIYYVLRMNRQAPLPTATEPYLLLSQSCEG